MKTTVSISILSPRSGVDATFYLKLPTTDPNSYIRLGYGAADFLLGVSQVGG
jgi:hypothetical protein